MKTLLSKCIEGHTLTEEEATAAMNQVMEGKATSSQIASFISILRFRGETVDELVGFAKAMKQHMTRIDYAEDLIDTCGTGGDGASTFNISTASAILASSLGAKVAKHGNRAISSKSGSADVLEQLGISIQTTPEEAKLALQAYDMSFLFAPIYHSSMKHAVSPRQEIGFRTVFNLLGPLANPANAKRQVMGVFSTEYAEKIAYALRELGSEHVLLVTGRDGLDECSITGVTDIVELKKGKIDRYEITPEEMGLERGELKDIQVESPAESAKLILDVFEGKREGAAADIVALNAGAALYIAGKTDSFADGVKKAADAIENGTAYRQLARLQSKKEEQYAY
ncbi:anthranilate phosphoribosyltransferase [Metabacillus hrfriensis]|uniref:Anthranilate phosphoribosyltransferase n=1 Tax=Metabacillus hrfriensis TaxID=3048891 RepID=A0ACD4R773_9BACI|nr:anthranilate phosphoribosyltransferase [Metabacillus sp. CT-WN-B3]WHZ56311.1 anthranilate phosphoribosyltransferase [Metabacillus sp. CT-WN-B3]